MVITNTSKRGFHCLTPCKVYDERGVIFWQSEKPRRFNLPKGQYNVVGQIEPLKAPVNYKLPKLPKRDRYHKLPEKGVTITYCDNPNKASIVLPFGDIYIDKAFLKLPRPVLAKIILHEIGHFYYEDEIKCDRYAAVKMLQLGYNPSQIALADFTALGGSHYSQKRKNCTHDLMKKI